MAFLTASGEGLLAIISSIFFFRPSNMLPLLQTFAVSPLLSLVIQKRPRQAPLSQFLLVLDAFVHQKLAVVGQGDVETRQGARRRALEVDTRDVVTAAVA